MMEDEIGERYRHLLQPLRDVSNNWELSIKMHLDEYLEKLRNDRERNAVRDDGDTIRFNFSEAAMLLQGSLQIFARKVDHLYEAIVEAYMGISNKKTTKKKTNATDQTLDTSAADAENSGRIKNDFALLDEKHKMLDQMVDTRWFLQNDRRKEPRDPVKVGTRRDVGKRDRFVDLPISFIPTKKSVPSVHHFRFEQNNEEIYIPQSDLFSFNATAYSNNDGSDMTVFMNGAYLDLIHEFTRKYIPYLRDENNQRLQRIGEPYNIEAPIEAYNRLLELDERENRGNTSQAFLATFYGENGGDTDDDNVNIVDLTAEGAPQNFLRPSLVEAPRESILPNGIAPELTDTRPSDFPNMDSAPTDITFGTAFDEGRSMRSTRLNSPFVSTAAEQEPQLDVEEELAFMDEYADVKSRLRSDANTKEKKRKKNGPRRAVEQCRIRDAQIKEKFAEQGKDYEKYKNNLAEYITAKLFSRKLCTFGSMLENLNPSLRSRHIQALNRVFYAQEKYEKAVKTQRRHEKLETERAKKKEEHRKRHEREQLKSLDIRAKKRRTQLIENDENKASGSADIPTQDGHQQPEEDEETEADYFGAQPIEDDMMAPDEIDDPDPEYNPAILMEREINELVGDRFNNDDYDDDLFDEVAIFDSQNNQPTEPQYVLGDYDQQPSTAANATTNLNETMLDLGSFATNDPAFFDLDKLVDFFSKTQFELVSEGELLVHAIQSFWTTVNEKEMCVPRQRLQQWSAHILERLDEDARHKPFEIHDYGSKILSSFGEGPSVIGSSLKFREIVKDVPKYEVSRYLLATLILANCGNVDVNNDGKQWDGVGKPIINKQTVLKLISLERHHEVFQSEQLLITS